jgi:hypothetical protein
MVERLIKYLQFRGIKTSEFERKIGLSRGHVNKINTISADMHDKISINFPDLNLNWLETGKGKMLNTRMVDRMMEYIKAKNLKVDDIDKKIYGERDIWVELGFQKPKARFFKQFIDNHSIDIHPRGIKYFIKNFAYDANPIWLLTGEGTMLVTDEKCSRCNEKDKKIEEQAKRIGALEYQLELAKSKKK